jgi:HEAT repeat protein
VPIKKGWLLIAVAVLVVLLAFFGYSRWQHHQLAKALHDPDPVVRMDAVRKAGSEDLLFEALHDDDPDIRYVAAWRLRACSHNAKTIRGLLEASYDNQSYVRKEALDVLRYTRAETRKLIYKGAEDEDWRIRAGAAYALIRVPDKDLGMAIIKAPPRPPNEKQIVVSIMIGLLKDENVEVRKAASFCLFSYDFGPEEALRIRSALKEAPLEKDQDARDLTDRLLRAAKQ